MTLPGGLLFTGDCLYIEADQDVSDLHAAAKGLGIFANQFRSCLRAPFYRVSPKVRTHLASRLEILTEATAYARCWRKNDSTAERMVALSEMPGPKNG